MRSTFIAQYLAQKQLFNAAYNNMLCETTIHILAVLHSAQVTAAAVRGTTVNRDLGINGWQTICVQPSSCLLMRFILQQWRRRAAAAAAANNLQANLCAKQVKWNVMDCDCLQLAGY